MSVPVPKSVSITESGPPQKPRRLLRVPEAMARLACGKTTFYEYVKQGRLPIVKLGTSTRVTEEALDQFIANLTGTETAKEASPAPTSIDGTLP